MKQFSTILFYFLYVSVWRAQSQTPVVEWQKCLGSYGGEYSRIIRPTSDGGYIVIGEALLGGGDVIGYHGNKDVGDIWLVKLSNSGAVQWTKCLGGNDFDQGGDVRQTPDGGYIVAATSVSTGCNVPNHYRGADYLVIKLTAGGDITWEKTFGGNQNEYAYSIDLTNDGGYIVGGFTESSDGDVTVNHGGRDFWIVKIDGTGNLKWQKSVGGSGDEEARGLRATNDGGCIVTGFTESNDGDVTGNHGKRDYWIVKLDNNGNMQWQKCLGGSESEEANSIQLTADGGYIVAGYAASDNGDVSGNHQSLGQFSDFWVVKLNSSGTIQWQKCYGGEFNEIAFYIQQADDGGYLVSGSSESADGDATCNAGYVDMWLIKINATGTPEWQKSMGGDNTDEAYCAQPLADGSFIIAGLVASENVSGYHITPAGTSGDYWIVKLSAPVFTSPSPSVTIIPHTGKVCAGSTATFTAITTYAGNNPVYQWLKNGVVVGTNSPVYTASGFVNNDNIICNVSNGSSCDINSFVVSDGLTIQIDNTLIQPQINITASSTLICNCTPVTFNASLLNGGAGSKYEWKVNGDTIEDNGSHFITNSLVPGDMITCIYSDSSGCILNGSVVSPPIQMSGGTGQVPSVSITTPSATICQGAPVTFMAAPVNAGINPFFQWKINGVNAGTNTNNFTTAAINNGDTISCSIKPDSLFTCALAGTVVSNNIIMTVTPKATPSVNIIASQDTACTGTQVTYKATVSNGGVNPTYQWRINNTNVGTNDSFFSTSSLINNDVITCTVTPDVASACINMVNATSNAITMTIKPAESPSVSIIASGNDVCEGNPVTFSALAQNAGTGPSYQWMINNVSLNGNASSFSSNSLADGDQINCVVTAGTGACAGSSGVSNTIVAIINAIPAITIIPADTLVNPGAQIRLNASVNGIIGSYEWSPAVKLQTASTLSPLTLPLTENTVYTLTVISDKGCKATSAAIVKISMLLSMPNAFSPNGDGINDLFRIPAGMLQSLQEFTVFDRWGNKIFTTSNINSPGWDGIFKGKQSVAGVYVYVIKGSDYKGPVSAKGSVILIR